MGERASGRPRVSGRPIPAPDDPEAVAVELAAAEAVIEIFADLAPASRPRVLYVIHELVAGGPWVGDRRERMRSASRWLGEWAKAPAVRP